MGNRIPIPHRHRLDEFPAGHSLARCSPAELASASPVKHILLDCGREALEDFSERGSEFIPCVSPQGFTPCLDSLTERVLAAIFEVSNTVGAGFLEKVYERALLRELALRGIHAGSQASLAVIYKGHHVGEYFADILVGDKLVVELKCVDRLASEHTA